MTYEAPSASTLATLRSSDSRPSPKSGITTTLQRSSRHEVHVLPVDAEQKIDPGLVGLADGLRVKGVDAHREPVLLEPGDDVAHAGERLHGRAAEVDHVGPARRGSTRPARGCRRTASGTPRRSRASILVWYSPYPSRSRACPKYAGRSLRSLGPRITGTPDLGLDGGEVAPAQAGDHDLVEAPGVGQASGDPLRAHERRHRPAEDGDVVREVQLEPVERLAAAPRRQVCRSRTACRAQPAPPPSPGQPLAERGVPRRERPEVELAADLRHRAVALGERVVLVDALEVLLASEDEARRRRGRGSSRGPGAASRARRLRRSADCGAPCRRRTARRRA